MADWTPIGNGELVADQPITESLLTRLRDNPIAMIERAPGAPAYGWAVTSTGNNANGYYRVWDDGFKEQWGFASRTASQTVITLPVSFSLQGTIQANAMHYNEGNSGGSTGSWIMLAGFGLTTITVGHGTAWQNIYWRAWGY
jgi:hypothetical protein